MDFTTLFYFISVVKFKISQKQGSSKVVMIPKERAKIYLRKKESFVWNATNIVKDTKKMKVKLLKYFKKIYKVAL